MASLPSDITYGTVVGRWVLAVADTTADTDREPDATFPEGTVTFTPVFKRVANTASPTIYVAPKPITGTLVNGVLCDKTGPGVTLVSGLYDVTFSIADVPIAGFQLSVAAGATVDVNEAAPVVPDPTVKYVVSEATYNEAIAAVARANAAADRAEAAGSTAPVSGWVLTDLSTGLRASIARADSASQPGHTHLAANISDASSVGRSVLTAADSAAARSAIGAVPESRTVGTGTGLTGGGDLTGNRTLSLSPASVASLGKADSASQPGHVHAVTDVTGLGTTLAAKADLVNGLIPTAQMPPLAITDTYVVASESAMLALSAQRGDLAKRSDLSGTVYVLATDDPTALSSWVSIASGAATGAVSSVNGQVGAVVLGKGDVGLGNVSNLAPADLPVSTATQSALNGKAATAHTHTASQITDSSASGRTLLTQTDLGLARAAINAADAGIQINSGTGLTGGGNLTADRTLALSTATQASLGKADTAVQPAALSAKADLVGGLVPTSQLPALAINDTFVVASQTAMLALTAQRGDIAKRTDLNGQAFVLSADDPTTVGNWVSLSTTSDVASVNGQTGTVVLGKADVGLGSVDNTSDANKPVSTATATALSAKAPLASPALTGTPTAPTATAGDASTALATTAFVDASFAKKASPAFTGTPTAPTAAAGTNTTQVATTAYALGTGDQTAATSTTAAAGTLTLPSTGSDLRRYQLQGNVTIALAAGTAGRGYTLALILAQDATGGRTVTWPSSIKWDGGTKPTVTSTASAIDSYTLLWTGTEWLGYVGSKAAA